jgi:transposase
MAVSQAEEDLTRRMWERIRLLVPAHPEHTRGGRPFADDFRCFLGIVYQLRNSIRWNDMPKEFPSGVTCWRRFDTWNKAGVWKRIHEIIVEELQAAGLLDLNELAIDATFVEARKGGIASEPRNLGSATRSRC